MLFRRRSRSHDSPVVQTVGDCSVQVSPTQARKTDTRHTLIETYVSSPKQTRILQKRGGSSDDSYRSSSSSPNQSPVQRKEPTPRRIPTSKKTGYATIRTDSTDTQPAFESDAFAVLMPTTRLPILDRPITRTKPAPSKAAVAAAATATARADAFKTYQKKAQQIRARNNSQGVKVPSRIVSYDYASRHLADHRTAPEVETVSPAPAGSFPISPLLSQYGWANPATAATVPKPASRHVHDLSNVTTSQKSTTTTSTSTKSTSPTSPSSNYRIYRADATAGANSGPPLSSLPASITVRVKPKTVVTVSPRVQPETRLPFYHRPSASTSSQSSTSTSPVKSMPNFTRHNSVEGDSLFGYNRKDPSATSPATCGSENKDVTKCKVSAKATPKGREKAAVMENATKSSPLKRTLTTRWPWLRSAGPRITKPTTAPVVFSLPTPPSTPTPAPAAKPAPRTQSGYVDPFTSHETPVPVPAPTPKSRLITPKSSPLRSTPSLTIVAPAPASPNKFDTGFAQIQTLVLLVCKICFALYAVVALWYVLDALREAAHTIGVPFRVLRGVGSGIWMGVRWGGGVVGAVLGRRG